MWCPSCGRLSFASVEFPSSTLVVIRLGTGVRVRVRVRVRV